MVLIDGNKLCNFDSWGMKELHAAVGLPVPRARRWPGKCRRVQLCICIGHGMRQMVPGTSDGIPRAVGKLNNGQGIGQKNSRISESISSALGRPKSDTGPSGEKARAYEPSAEKDIDFVLLGLPEEKSHGERL